MRSYRIALAKLRSGLLQDMKYINIEYINVTYL